MRKKYTRPVINKGKEPLSIPKGSSKAKELAKNIWYIEYRYDGKRIRIKGNLNRLKDSVEKELEANRMLDILIQDLEDGFSPLEQEQYVERKERENISLKDAIKVFCDYHVKMKSRPSTIASYKSKLNHLLELHPTKNLNEITTSDIENFIHQKIADGVYSNKSVSIAKRIFKTFFHVLNEEGYPTDVNPAEKINKKIKSFKEIEDSHVPYSPEQLKAIMDWLDEHNPYMALFSRFIYYTCLRPGEIKGLEVRDIDLKSKTIRVRPTVKKVTNVIKDDIINIPENFIPHLEALKLEQYPKNWFVLGDTKTIVNEKKVSKNVPLYNFMLCLKALKLDNQGHTLYSIKHTSNIQKWKNGWDIEQIMVANRHSNVDMTLKYLRNLSKDTSTKDLTIPSI